MATKHKDPVFTGMPTPRKVRFVTFWIIAGMLALTSCLHYTEAGQTVFGRITGTQSSHDLPQEQNRPNTTAPGGWDDLLNQGAQR